MKKIFLLTLIVASFIACSKGKKTFNIPDGWESAKKEISVTVDTAIKPDFSMLDQALVFPGLVSKEEPRVKDKEITLNLNYVDEQFNRLKISVLPQPLFSTGMYAPAGEIIYIDVPANAVGLECQIGAWTDNLSSKTNPGRYPVVFNRQTLVAGRVNMVRNLFGGNIYLKTSYPLQEPVTFKFTGTVESPDFILDGRNSNAITSQEVWKQKILNTTVPRFEFGGKHIIFTLPTERMKLYLQQNPDYDMVANINAWNDIILEDYYKWQGLSDTASNLIDKQAQLPWRFVLDKDISVGYGHSGYPIMAMDDNYWFMTTLNGGLNSDMWGTLHEIGHNNQQQSYWSWSALGEVTCNLFSFKRAIRINYPYARLHGDGDIFINKALEIRANPAFSDFNSSDLKFGVFHRLVPFVQIYHKAQRWDGQDDGWGFMRYLYKRARYAARPSLTDIDKQDFFYEALCEYTGKNWLPFMNAWKIRTSAYSQELMKKKYPERLNLDIWNYNPLTNSGGNNIVDTKIYASDRNTWTITVDSEERSGEGPNNGAARFCLDGDFNTFWHTKWQGGAPPYPHECLVDMGAVKELDGIAMAGRKGNNRQGDPARFKVYIGDDPNNLSEIAVTPNTFVRSQDLKDYEFPSAQRFRYFKIVFEGSAANRPYMVISELTVFEK